MASIESVALDVADPADAKRFYANAFGLETQIHPRASEAPTIGFRGFTVSQSATADSLIGSVPVPRR
ncbi:hypothetical protein [Amycolatopsis circi]|uniref:VOC family protein n=1 Tax=Amycolatopsis circi TaxID=871959 RepID=UPI003134571F